MDSEGDEEDAWGDGTRFTDRGSTATYFTYTMQVPSCDQPGGHCTVFVTSRTFTGDLVSGAEALGLLPSDGLEAGDLICQFHAAEANLDGTYKAWLSSSGPGNAAADRLTQAAVPYVLVDGETRVADDWGDLTTCEGVFPFEVCLSHAIDRTQGGDFPPVPTAWTGSSSSGELFRDDESCVGWSSSSGSDDGRIGVPGEVGTAWTFGTFIGCDFEDAAAVGATLYCFQQ